MCPGVRRLGGVIKLDCKCILTFCTSLNLLAYQFLQFRNLSITTCHKSQNIGARIEYNHDGHITKQEATARPHGTTVTLQNLFSTLPVRHKEFLRNIKREYTKMMQVLQGYCVISTGVRISCHTIGEKGKKSLALATNSNRDMRENISNVFGPKQVGFYSVQLPSPYPGCQRSCKVYWETFQAFTRPLFMVFCFSFSSKLY